MSAETIEGAIPAPSGAGTFAALTERLIARNVPVHALYEITERCNYACSHCYLPHRGDAELTTAEALDAIDQLAEAGTIFLTLSGGEIFLRRDVWEIAERAVEREMVLRLFTNGYLVDEEKADRLAALAPIGVEISLYGHDAPTFETLTKVPGSFERTVRAIRLLCERGVRVVAKTPITRVNARGIQQMHDLASALGAVYQFDPLITPMDGGETTPFAMRPTQEDLAHVFAFEKKILDEMGYVKPKPKPVSDAPCNAGRGALAISPRGDVYPCVAIKEPAGNLREKRLTEIWYGDAEILTRLRGITIATLKTCATCDDRPFCPRCAGVARHEEGDLDLPSAEACRIAATKRAVFEGRPIPTEGPRRPGHRALRILEGTDP